MALNAIASVLRRFVGAPRDAAPVPEGPRQLSQSIPNFLEAAPQYGALFEELWAEYDAVHGIPSDPMRVLQFMYLVDIANRAAPGDYLELGTHRGFTARLIYRVMDQSRTLTLLDTFEGFVEQDLVAERQIYPNDWHVGNFLPTSPELVASYVGGGSPPANVKVVKGWFPEAYAGLEGHAWRFVHIDFDLYQPIRTGLDLIWPQLVPGGVMVVHDYGCAGFPGVKIAVDEFSASVGLTPMPMGDRWGSMVLIKPHTPRPNIRSH